MKKMAEVRSVLQVINVAIAVLLCSVQFGNAFAQVPDGQKSDHPIANDTRKYICPPCGCDSDGRIFNQPGKCPDCGMELVDKSNVLNVAIVVWDGVELLDFAGPGEVFAAARSDDGRSFQVFTVAASKQPIVSQGFLSINPQYAIDDCPPVDIMVLPGGGTSNVTGDEKLMAWVKKQTASSQITLSVCTGAFVLAENGSLNDLDATTWHGAVDRLRQQFPNVRVHADRRFIDNGRIITSAGVSAGIDSSLHVVSKLFGEESAVNTARYMEYNWQKK